MSETDDADIKKVMNEIVTYLRQRHNAADTADGIRLWWLQRGASRSAEQVHTAILRLLDEGMIEEQEIWDGKRVYRALHTGHLH